MYMIKIMSELQIENRSDRDLRSCEVTLQSAVHSYDLYHIHFTSFMDLLNKAKDGVQCMLVKFFVRKAVWLKFTVVNADCLTPKTPRSCYPVICESNQRTFHPHERGRAMHAGKVLCAQSSLVKVYGG